MNPPPPVDLNRLKGILGASKAIMNKVETGNFQTGNIDARALTEEGVGLLQAEGVKRPAMSSPIQSTYDEETIRNSRLPESIKRAMIENPIQQIASPNYTFSIDDVSELADKPMGFPKAPKTQQVIRESYGNSDMISISKAELKEMVSSIVNEKLLEYMTKSNDKRITEDAVKRTINVLIKEGKILPKKKTL